MKIISYNILKPFLILTCFTLLSACNNSSPKESRKEESQKTILVFAAASLTDVLTEIIDSFEMKYAIDVQVNLASSGTLARQIEQGGNPGIYLSASQKWADYMDSLGFIIKESKVELAQNQLVLVAPKNNSLAVNQIDSFTNLPDILGGERLSMGDPTHVPAGQYALQALSYYGWHDQLKGRTLYAKDVRSALMVVELGETPLGIVYRTDAMKSEKVKILATFPQESYSPVVYVGGLLKKNEAAAVFLNFLVDEELTVVWTKYGFIR